MGNINFVSDTTQLIPLSVPSMFALYKLMKKNKSLVIRIEGHLNGVSAVSEDPTQAEREHRIHPPDLNLKEYCQWLSDERAIVVYKYLVAKGINSTRLSTYGYSADKMLFPNAINADEREQNRRVEINVISFK